MPSKWPVALDQFPAQDNKTANHDAHAAFHNEVGAAVTAIQTTLGTEPFDWSGLVEDWHVVGDPGEPAFEKLETSKGPQQLWLTPGAPFPGYGTKWSEEEPNYKSEHKAWGVPPLAFYKDPLGVVHLRGGAVEFANPYSLWSEEPSNFPSWEEAGVDLDELKIGNVFTLPAGYRPDAEFIFTGLPLQTIEKGELSGQSPRATVHPSGLITLGEHVSGGFESADDLIRFDGIRFRAA